MSDTGTDVQAMRLREALIKAEAQVKTLTAKLELVRSLSHAAGRAEGYRAGYDDAAASFEPITTQAWAAGRAEGLAEIKRLRDALESVDAEIMLTGNLGDIVDAALASDPVAGDQVAELAKPTRADLIEVAHLVWHALDDGEDRDEEFILSKESAVAVHDALMKLSNGEEDDIHYVLFPDAEDAPAPAPGLAAQEVERLKAIETAASGDLQYCTFCQRFAHDRPLSKALSAPRPAQAKEGPTE